MNYCIVIKFTRSEIAFRYNRDDDPTVSNRLAPMNDAEPVLPLALYVDDNRVELSATARLNAQRGVEGYYDGILDRLGEDRRFTVAGRDYGFADLLLLAIEHRLTAFYSDVLLGARGPLSENRATMPLTLVMDHSVQPRVRSRIVNLLRTAGYNAVNTLDELPLLLDQARAVSGQHEAVMVLNVDGDDLYCHLYRRGEADAVHIPPIAGAGRDPRVEQLARELWQGTDGVRYQDPQAREDVEMTELRQLAARFIARGVKEIYDEPYTATTGRRCYLNVDKLFMSNLNVAGSDLNLVNAVGQVLSEQQVNPASCVMFLAGHAASGYVAQALSGHYTVYGQDSALLDSQILRWAYEQAGSRVHIDVAGAAPTHSPVMAGKAEDVVRILTARADELQPIKARVMATGVAMVQETGTAINAALDILRRTTDYYITFDRYTGKFDEARQALAGMAQAKDDLDKARADYETFTATLPQAMAMAQQFGHVDDVKQLVAQLQSAQTAIAEMLQQTDEAFTHAADCFALIAHYEEVLPQYRALRDRLDAAATTREKDALWQSIVAQELTLEPCPVPTACRITGGVEVTKSGFMGMKKTRSLSLDIEVLDGKTLPFETLLIVQDRPLVSIDRSRAFVMELGEGLSGTRHEALTLPLAGCPPTAKRLYVYLKPAEGLDQNTLIACPPLQVTLE